MELPVADTALSTRRRRLWRWRGRSAGGYNRGSPRGGTMLALCRWAFRSRRRAMLSPALFLRRRPGRRRVLALPPPLPTLHLHPPFGRQHVTSRPSWEGLVAAAVGTWASSAVTSALASAANAGELAATNDGEGGGDSGEAGSGASKGAGGNTRSGAQRCCRRLAAVRGGHETGHAEAMKRRPRVRKSVGPTGAGRQRAP